MTWTCSPTWNSARVRGRSAVSLWSRRSISGLLTGSHCDEAGEHNRPRCLRGLGALGPLYPTGLRPRPDEDVEDAAAATHLAWPRGARGGAGLVWESLLQAGCSRASLLPVSDLRPT